MSLLFRGGPEYLIRFDDICSTMSWATWNEAERILLDNDVRPIMAVVPDNGDPELNQEPANPQFWDRVRRWQELGWTIGLHGYNHKYVTKSQGLIGLNRYSEFAGLPYDEQHRKLAAGLEIMQREFIVPKLWVAPAHTFDAETLRALRDLGIVDLSDGFGLYPHRDENGSFWIPAQLGTFRWFPHGLWTVCIHLNDPLHTDMRAFAHHIKRLRPYITDVQHVRSKYSGNHRRAISATWGTLFRWSKSIRNNVP